MAEESRTPIQRSMLKGHNKAKRKIRDHPKTRTGCKTCKKRKIKCDEHHPACRNCVKYAVKCDFTEITDSTPTAAKYNATIDPETPLHMLDLELLHNFTSSTYASLSDDQTVRNTYKIAVVRRGLSCEFLMRTILSVSAMHIAQHRPEQKHHYMSQGIAHHRVAASAATSLMTDVLPQHQENLWLFSVLTIFFALGNPKTTTSSLLIGEDVVPDWILLLKGVQQISLLVEPDSYEGILSPILRHGRARLAASRNAKFTDDSLLQDLLSFVCASVSDPQELTIYTTAIEELRRQLNFVLNAARQNLDMADATMWQFRVSDSFMSLVKQNKQEAVAIFAHSSVIFHVFKSHAWLDGWATHLLSRAWDILDEEHRLWIQWPIEEIGWVPPSGRFV